MDRAIPQDERARIIAVLEKVKAQGGDYHRLRTRISGKKSFVDVHVLVPGGMSVHDGHDLAERLEREIQAAVPHVEVLTHLEPLEDPRSWDDPARPMGGS
jgi:divalent metal cation (Fe/Co/Zn/Cd) transporter